MAVEIIPKQKRVEFPGESIFFSLSILVLILTIASYLFLIYSQKKEETNLRIFEEKIEKTRTSEMISLEKDVLETQRRVKDFSKLLGEHVFDSKAFIFLEGKFLPNVFISKITLDAKSFGVNLFGQTDSFLSLGQQVLVLESDPKIKQVELPSVSIGKGGEIEFGLNILLDPSVFKQ